MSKPYLSPSQQVQYLISRKGLIIRDVAYAERKLTDIEYTSSGVRSSLTATNVGEVKMKALSF